jgi:hypothetical protein
MHTQNLIDTDRAKQYFFFHKRGWAKRWSWEAFLGKKINGDWLSCEITIGGTDDHRPKNLKIHFSLLGSGFYINFKSFVPNRFQIPKNGEYNFDESWGRRYGFSIYENHWSAYWHQTVICSGKNGSKYGWRWSTFIDEFLFGRRKYEQRNLVKHEKVPVKFPEKTYHVSIELSEDTWTYKGWPWWPLTRVIKRCHINVLDKKGILSPGKGESEWDCGDNNLFGSTFPASSLEEAIELFKKSVFETRSKYGSGPDMYKKKKVKKNEVVSDVGNIGGDSMGVYFTGYEPWIEPEPLSECEPQAEAPAGDRPVQAPDPQATWGTD